MDNNNLNALQSFTGKEISASPSPFMLWLKPIALSAERGKLCFQYSVRKEMTNPIGTLHGGVTAAIIDDIIGATMYSLDETFFNTTLSNVIDYYSAARENDILVAESTLVKNGTQFANAECIVWNQDKTRMIAKGYSTMFKIQAVTNQKIDTNLYEEFRKF
jgi:acyl-coenzyme A thioesterase 13